MKVGLLVGLLGGLFVDVEDAGHAFVDSKDDLRRDIVCCVDVKIVDAGKAATKIL
jgi:hypothetical protein